MHFFYSEVFHLANLFTISGVLLNSLLYVGGGMALRGLSKTRKAFYLSSVGILLLWLASEMTSVFLFYTFTRINIVPFCFNLSWALFCFMVGAWIFHFLCLALRKLPLK